MADFKQEKGDFSILRFRRIGNYFSSFITGCTTVADLSISAIGSLRAFPFYVPKTIKVDRIAMKVTTAASAGGVARMGIYADDGTCFPGARVVDGGEVAVDSTGVKESTIDVTLRGGKLYWLVVICGVATGTKVQGIPIGSVMGGVLGIDNSLTGNTITGWASVQTYGALPATYPTATVSVWALTQTPLIALRKAA